jgi:hypothetical protein
MDNTGRPLELESARKFVDQWFASRAPTVDWRKPAHFHLDDVSENWSERMLPLICECLRASCESRDYDPYRLMISVTIPLVESTCIKMSCPETWDGVLSEWDRLQPPSVNLVLRAAWGVSLGASVYQRPVPQLLTPDMPSGWFPLYTTFDVDESPNGRPGEPEYVRLVCLNHYPPEILIPGPRSPQRDGGRPVHPNRADQSL